MKKYVQTCTCMSASSNSRYYTKVHVYKTVHVHYSLVMVPLCMEVQGGFGLLI